MSRDAESLSPRRPTISPLTPSPQSIVDSPTYLYEGQNVSVSWHEALSEQLSLVVPKCDASQCHRCPLWPGEIHHVCPMFLKAIVDALLKGKATEYRGIPRASQISHAGSSGSSPTRSQRQRSRPVHASASVRPLTVSKPGDSRNESASPARVIVTRAVSRARELARRQLEAQQAARVEATIVEEEDVGEHNIADTTNIGAQVTAPGVTSRLSQAHTPPEQIDNQCVSQPALSSTAAQQPLTRPNRPQGSWGADGRGSPFPRIPRQDLQHANLGNITTNAPDSNQGNQYRQSESPSTIILTVEGNEAVDDLSEQSQGFWQRALDASEPATADDVFGTDQAPALRSLFRRVRTSLGDITHASNERASLYGPAVRQIMPSLPTGATAAPESMRPQPSLLEQFNSRVDDEEMGQSPRYSPQDSPPPVNRRLDFTRRDNDSSGNSHQE